MAQEQFADPYAAYGAASPFYITPSSVGGAYSYDPQGNRVYDDATLARLRLEQARRNRMMMQSGYAAMPYQQPQPQQGGYASWLSPGDTPTYGEGIVFEGPQPAPQPWEWSGYNNSPIEFSFGPRG